MLMNQKWQNIKGRIIYEGKYAAVGVNATRLVLNKEHVLMVFLSRLKSS